MEGGTDLPEISPPVLGSAGKINYQAQLNNENLRDDQNGGFLPSELSSKKLFDFQRKIRDLEIQVIDLKGIADRRMHAMSESLNTKLDREIKNMLSKQTSTENQQNQNFQIASD